MKQYQFELLDGSIFTIPAGSTEEAWYKAIEFLDDQGQLSDLSSLKLIHIY